MTDKANIELAVSKVLARGRWPINRDYDDAGLSERNYVEFVKDVLAELRAQNKKSENMTHPWANTQLPLAMAQRMAFNRDATATERHGFLEVHRRGEYLGALPIADGCVRYLDFSGLLAVLVGHRR